MPAPPSKEKIEQVERQIKQELDRRLVDLTTHFRQRAQQILSPDELQLLAGYLNGILGQTPPEITPPLQAVLKRLEADGQAKQLYERMLKVMELRERAAAEAGFGPAPQPPAVALPAPLPTLPDNLRDALAHAAQMLAGTVPNPEHWVGWLVSLLEHLDHTAAAAEQSEAFEDVLERLGVMIANRIQRKKW